MDDCLPIFNLWQMVGVYVNVSDWKQENSTQKSRRCVILKQGFGTQTIHLGSADPSGTWVAEGIYEKIAFRRKLKSTLQTNVCVQVSWDNAAYVKRLYKPSLRLQREKSGVLK